MEYDKLAKDLCQDHERLKSDRAYWENHWQDIRELVRPASKDIMTQSTPGRSKVNNIYDSTAPHANETLAAGLQSFLMSDVEPWFELKMSGFNESRDPELKAWLQYITELIYHQYTLDDAHLQMAASELFLDLGSFGTGVLNQEWNRERQHVQFRAYSIADCYVKENYDGFVDTLHRETLMTTRQIRQEWPDGTKHINEEKNEDKLWTVLHIVRPRSDRNMDALTPEGMPFASFWIVKDCKEMLEESGYRTFPYHVPRWIKLADETYGRSPAMKALPDIKLINAMEYVLIKVGQKAADPPLVLPNDGFLLPIKTHPGAMIFKEPGVEEIQVLPDGSQNLPINLEMVQNKREIIRQAFYADWLKLEKMNKEMTAFEVADRREEKLRLMSPMLGRQQSELLGPMIARTYNLLWWHGMIPPAPAQYRGNKLRVSYTSPAAKAQQGVKATDMARFIQELIPLAQVDPGILDVVDLDIFAQEVARIRGVNRMIIRSPEQIAEIRTARQQQEQVAQAAAIAEPATKAMKNLSDANIDPSTVGAALGV